MICPCKYRFIRYDERGCGLSDWDATDFTLRRLGRPISSRWWKRLDWSAFRCSACRRAARSRWPTPPDIPSGSASWCCAARMRAGARCGRWVRRRSAPRHWISISPGSAGAVTIPAFRQVFAAQFLPDGTRADWAAFDQLQRRTTSPENAVRFLRGVRPHRCARRGAQVSCPTLIMHSRDDHRVPHALRRGTGRADSRFPTGRAVEQQPSADRDRAGVAGVPRRGRRLPGGADGVPVVPSPAPRSPRNLHTFFMCGFAQPFMLVT